jgi:hypothetical protein
VLPGGDQQAGPAEPAELPAELAASSKYEVLKKLGQGAMGSVWKAQHTFLDCLVAIKVLNPDVLGRADVQDRFLQEMRATGKLRHRHIVWAIDADQVGGLLFIVMEYVEGVTLDRLVQQKGALPVRFACRCALQAAEGLQHAHEQGMAHRDIKPANLMVTAKDQEVKILDFGLARLPKGQGVLGNRTQVQTFMGTPEYVSPEQATDAAAADIRSDIYSLGCTLYFLLAGEPPFRGNTMMDTLLAQIQEEPRPLPELRGEVPAGLWAVVARMLQKHPGKRFQTPAEVADALLPFATPRARNPAGEGVFEEAAAPRSVPRGMRTGVANWEEAAPPLRVPDDDDDVRPKMRNDDGVVRGFKCVGGAMIAALAGVLVIVLLCGGIATVFVANTIAHNTAEVNKAQADAELKARQTQLETERLRQQQAEAERRQRELEAQAKARQEQQEEETRRRLEADKARAEAKQARIEAEREREKEAREERERRERLAAEAEKRRKEALEEWRRPLSMSAEEVWRKGAVLSGRTVSLKATASCKAVASGAMTVSFKSPAGRVWVRAVLDKTDPAWDLPVGESIRAQIHLQGVVEGVAAEATVTLKDCRVISLEKE